MKIVCCFFIPYFCALGFMRVKTERESFKKGKVTRNS